MAAETLTEKQLTEKLTAIADKIMKDYEKAVENDAALDLEIKQYAEQAAQLSELIKRFHIHVAEAYLLYEDLLAVEATLKAGALSIAPEAKTRLQSTYQIALSDYLATTDWYSPDPYYRYLASYPVSFKTKSGGAKNAGERTGVYTFETQEQKSHILIKQADVGETIAEFMGAKLYGLTMPDQAAECVLFRDKTRPQSLDSVYVGSVYAKADRIQDAFEAAGYKTRGLFAGTKALRNRAMGKNQSLIHKILAIDETQANHTLPKAAANALWHGDHDFHAGNFVLVEKHGKKTFVKIDHGFSFFNFGPDLVNVRSATAGQVMKVKDPRKHKNPFEFFPTNHYWDILQADPSFFRSPYFLSACDEICDLKPKHIKAVIHAGLEDVIKAYDASALAALMLFAERIGMKDFVGQDVDTLRESLCDYMVNRLLQRQASLMKMKTAAESYVQKPQAALSLKIQEAIEQGEQSLVAYEAKSTLPKPPVMLSSDYHRVERNRHNLYVHQSALNRYDAIKDKVPTKSQNAILKQMQHKTLQSAIYALKLLKEANDAGYLSIDENQKWGLSTDQFRCYVTQSGLTRHNVEATITRQDFKLLMQQFEEALPQTRKMLGLQSNTLKSWLRAADKIEKRLGRLGSH